MITLNFGSTFSRETGPISLLHTIDYMQFERWAGGVIMFRGTWCTSVPLRLRLYF